MPGEVGLIGQSTGRARPGLANTQVWRFQTGCRGDGGSRGGRCLVHAKTGPDPVGSPAQFRSVIRGALL